MQKEIYDEIHTVFQKNKIDSEIYQIYDGDRAYLVNTKTKGEINTDPYYVVHKKTKNVMPFNPIVDIDWFTNAKKNPL